MLDRHLERLERLGGPQLRDGARMLHLQQLHRPLDVGQAARPQLEMGLGVRAAGQPFRVHARLDRGRQLKVDGAHIRHHLVRARLKVRGTVDLAHPRAKAQPAHRAPLDTQGAHPR